MAVRNGQYQENQLRPAALAVQWSGLQQGDTGDWMLLGHYKYKNAHFFGTLGPGVITLEGSNEIGDPQYPVRLKDAFGNDIAIAGLDAFLREVHENPLKIRPKIEGGDGTTNMAVVLVCRH